MTDFPVTQRHWSIRQVLKLLKQILLLTWLVIKIIKEILNL